MKKYHPINGELVEVPEREKPKVDDYEIYKGTKYQGTRYAQYDLDLASWKEYINSLPRYPMSEGLKKWVSENKKEYYTEDDFKLRLIGASWCKKCNDYADSNCLTKHIHAIGQSRLEAVPIEEAQNNKIVNMDIKDYLPLYLGCECEYSHSGGRGVLCEIDEQGGRLKGVFGFGHIAFPLLKPLLRPLSDMTEEERKEAEIVHDGNVLTTHFESMRYLLKKEFDLFGLIPAGLAIDKTKQ